MSQKMTNHEVLTRYCDALLARFPDQSSVVISERRFREWSPLIRRVKEEGIEVWRKSRN